MSRKNASFASTATLGATASAVALLGLSLLGLSVLSGCGGDDDDAPPPPPPIGANGQQGQIQGQQGQQGQIQGQIQGQGQFQPTPPGQVMVTVVANSTPQGAQVTGGGRVLGVTPLTTQVPIPAPQPGAPPQTFQFTFAVAGFQPATINAAPVNNTITITAALAPATGAAPPGGEEEAGGFDNTPSGGGRVLNVRGRGGGPIFDNHTTRGSANVSEACTIARLQVRLQGSHSFNRDLVITLTGPGGQRYTLQRSNRRNPFRTYSVRRAVGRSAQGTWNLAIADTLRQDAGRLSGWGMNIACR